MRIIPIAFAFDNHLLLPAKVCITSLLLSAEEETFYHIFILEGDDEKIERADFIRIEEFYTNCKIEFRTVPSEMFKDCYEVRGITIPTYYRLMIPEIIKEYDKILYSDVDVIFREDQAKYYSISFPEDCYVAGVNSLAFLDQPLENRLPEELEDGAIGFFYAGNLVFNSKVIREQDITARFIEEMKNDYHFQDMEVLNRVCQNHALRLPPAFCFTPGLERKLQTRREELGEVFSDKEITEAFMKGTVHYAGPKPWESTMCLDADVWWSVYRKSLFFDATFTYDFWQKQFNWYKLLSLKKRLGLLLHYFKKN